MSRSPGQTLKFAFARHAYSLAWWLALPLVMLYLLRRSRRQPEYRRHWAERFGRFERRTLAAESGRPAIWVHAVSVGETRAAQPLIEALLAHYPQHRLVLTHMTPTGRETGHALFGGRVEQCYLPYDVPGFMNRFIAHHRPALGLIMETELWPNLVACALRVRLPLLLVNARLSEQSLKKALRTRWLIEPALQGLAAVLAQTQADAQRLAALGRADATVLGNIKFDMSPDETLLALGRAWRRRVGRPVVLLASSRDGEESLVLDAWLAATTSRATLAIVPRHPQRFGEVRALLESGPLHASVSAHDSTGNTGEPKSFARLVDRDALATGQGGHASYILGDSMGEMAAWYALADVVIMGGSLQPFGGQNLIEPCACGKPVVVGESTFNFEEAAGQAVDAGAALRVTSAREAVASALGLVADERKRMAMASAASRFALAHRGATARTMQVVVKYVEAAGSR